MNPYHASESLEPPIERRCPECGELSATNLPRPAKGKESHWGAGVLIGMFWTWTGATVGFFVLTPVLAMVMRPQAMTLPRPLQSPNANGPATITTPPDVCGLWIIPVIFASVASGIVLGIATACYHFERYVARVDEEEHTRVENLHCG